MSHYRGETNSSHKDPKNHRRNGAPEELSRRFETEDAYRNMGRMSPKVKEDDGKNHDLTSVVKTQVKTQNVTGSREWVWERPLDRGKLGTGHYVITVMPLRRAVLTVL